MAKHSVGDTFVHYDDGIHPRVIQFGTVEAARVLGFTEPTMPAKSEKQRKMMGAELQRKREGKPTKTKMSTSQLRDFAKKPVKRKG